MSGIDPSPIFSLALAAISFLPEVNGLTKALNHSGTAMLIWLHPLFVRWCGAYLRPMMQCQSKG
jgi:hypothetical protein